MARPDNAISVYRAQGATLKEVPNFVVGSWGPAISRFAANHRELSISLATLAPFVREEKKLELGAGYEGLIPHDAVSFLGWSDSNLIFRYSPKMNEVLIHKSDDVQRRRATRKAMHVTLNPEGFISEANFVEKFTAPNGDLAHRGVKVNFNPSGLPYIIFDERSVVSNYDYLASGLEGLPGAETIKDGRVRQANLTYLWARGVSEPIVSEGADLETSVRVDHVKDLEPLAIALSQSLTRGEMNDWGTPISLATTHPYNYLVKMLPPDKSLGGTVGVK